MAINTSSTSNFLTSFARTTPKLYITAETDRLGDFDAGTLRAWREEGFDVRYVPMGPGGRRYAETLRAIPDSLPLGEYFGLVAFGDAAATCLELFRRPSNKLCVLVAYYPSTIPNPADAFPVGVKVLVHLAGEEVGVTRNPELLGIQGRRRTVWKSVPRGKGPGGLLELGYPVFVYEDVEPGFAEGDLKEFDKVAAGLSWSRSLDAVRKAFKVEVDSERFVEELYEHKFKTKDAGKTLQVMAERPHVTCVPTMAGGIGRKDLKRFYDDFFIHDNPPTMEIKLLSRTIGSDRVVDEMRLSFEHTQEMPWMLPNILPTNKKVDIAIVSIVCVKGGRLAHEHIYWDQASVLVQIGLLDASMVPEAFRKDVERLPIAGRESARKVEDEESEPSNEMIDDW